MQNFPTKVDSVSTLPAAEYNNLTSELKNIVTTSGQSLTAADTYQLAKSLANYVSNGNYYTDSGIANAYTLTTVGAKSSITGFFDGLTAYFRVGNTNTGASTINVASLGVKNIKKSQGAADLAAGDLSVGSLAEVVYSANGDYFELTRTEFVANDFLKKNVSSTTSVGYPTVAYSLGNSGTGTVTPTIAHGAIQTIIVNGSFTLAAPTDSDSGYIEIQATNNATGGYSVDISAFTLVEGSYDSTASKVNLFRIFKVGSTSYLTIKNIPVASTVIPVSFNAIINGGMDLWQRNTSFASVANGTFTADRWKYSKTGSMVDTITRSTSVPTPDTNTPLFNYSLLSTVTTAQGSLGASDFNSIDHPIEGYNFKELAQRTMTLSFWVNSSVTGTFCVGLTNSGSDRSYVAEYTISNANTWERKVITISASPSAGTWNYTNGTGLVVRFTKASGTTYQTAAGSWATGNYLATSNQTNLVATNSATFAITGVQLERGSYANPFVIESFGEIVRKCQRYFEKSYDLETVPGTASAAGNRDSSNQNLLGTGSASQFQTFNFLISKRTDPTVVIYASSTGASGFVTQDDNSTVALGGVGTNQTCYRYSYTNTSGRYAGQHQMTASCEL